MMDRHFYLPAPSYGPTSLWAPPPPRGLFAPLTSPQRWVKSHFFLTMRWSWKQRFIVLLEIQISPTMTLSWRNIKCKHTNSTKAGGQHQGEDHSLGQGSMSLSSCANSNKKCFMEPFQAEMQNAPRNAGMVSHSTPVVRAQWDWLHHFISKRWPKRWLWITSSEPFRVGVRRRG